LFLFYLAKELGMTVSKLCDQLTHEELVSWAAFFELQAEKNDKAQSQSQLARKAQVMG
jgi:hypothetical protein